MPAPSVIIRAGANGSGKSTLAPALLRDYAGVSEFVNADVIAQGLSMFHPESAALTAGRVMLRRLRELAGERRSFAFETTLATSSFAPWLRELREQGYQIHIVFLPSPELAVQRVARRARHGGHNVPIETIRRRYRAGLSNFFRRYRPIADVWRLLDSSSDAMRPIAYGSGAKSVEIQQEEIWNHLITEYL